MPEMVGSCKRRRRVENLELSYPRGRTFSDLSRWRVLVFPDQVRDFSVERELISKPKGWMEGARVGWGKREIGGWWFSCEGGKGWGVGHGIIFVQTSYAGLLQINLEYEDM